MIGAFNVLADKAIQLIIALQSVARLDFFAAEGIKCFLAEDFTGDTNTVTEIDPILFVAHIIELNARIILRVSTAQRNLPARW